MWHQVNPRHLDRKTETGAYGILQPIPSLPQIDLTQVGVILVPAVACDRRGYRLGYGAGFYDRFLPSQVGFKVGVVFADYQVEELPGDPWDIPMQAVCTEAGLVKVVAA